MGTGPTAKPRPCDSLSYIMLTYLHHAVLMDVDKYHEIQQMQRPTAKLWAELWNPTEQEKKRL